MIGKIQCVKYLLTEASYLVSLTVEYAYPSYFGKNTLHLLYYFASHLP